MATTREPQWMTQARALIGVEEIVGSKHEPKIVQFFADAGNSWVHDDETAWCGAFVAAMLVRAGHREWLPPGEKGNALRAREWLKVGQPTDTPQLGDLTIFWRGSKAGASGHVAFFIREIGNDVEVLGGNQSNAVSIARYPRARLLGYRALSAAKSESAFRRFFHWFFK